MFIWPFKNFHFESALAHRLYLNRRYNISFVVCSGDPYVSIGFEVGDILSGFYKSLSMQLLQEAISENLIPVFVNHPIILDFSVRF